MEFGINLSFAPKRFDLLDPWWPDADQLVHDNAVSSVKHCVTELQGALR